MSPESDGAPVAAAPDHLEEATGADFVAATVGGELGLDERQKEAHELEEGNTPLPVNALENHSVSEPYSVFTRGGRVFVVVCASLAGFMSPFAINIFMPALPEIKRDLDISAGESLLSVTMYMILQGLSPSFWAPIADSAGRRPVLIAAFTVFLGANIGLAFCDRFWLLLVLRMLQASGASSAIAIGSGCISDVSHLAERGTYMGYFQSGVVSPC